MKYEYCDDCPDCLLLDGESKDTDGWMRWGEYRCCNLVMWGDKPRYLGQAHDVKRPISTITPAWCPRKQENYEQEAAQAAEEAKEYGGRLIRKPLDPKCCACDYQHTNDDDPYYWGSADNCYSCEHSFYIGVNGKNFWCCRHGEPNEKEGSETDG
jgi:hypothetical protein